MNVRFCLTLLAASLILWFGPACGRSGAAKVAARAALRARVQRMVENSAWFLVTQVPSVLAGPKPMVAVGGQGRGYRTWTVVIDPLTGAVSKADAPGEAVQAVTNWFDDRGWKVYAVDAAGWHIDTLDQSGHVLATTALDLGVQGADEHHGSVAWSAATDARGSAVAVGLSGPSGLDAVRIELFDAHTGRHLPRPGPDVQGPRIDRENYLRSIFWDRGGHLLYVSDGELRRMDVHTGRSTSLLGPTVPGASPSPFGPGVRGAQGSPFSKFIVAWTYDATGSRVFLFGPGDARTQLPWTGALISYAEADASGKHVLVTPDSVWGTGPAAVSVLTKSRTGAALDAAHARWACWLDAPRMAVLVGATTIQTLDMQTGERRAVLDLDKWLSRNK